MRQPLIVITGPTASGKSALALRVAQLAQTQGRKLEIINADSVQMYRGFDIGSAKPTAAERALIPHHLIDIAEPEHQLTAGDFVRALKQVLTELDDRDASALVVGGSGLYLKAALFGLWDTGETPTSPDTQRTRRHTLTPAELIAARQELTAARERLQRSQSGAPGLRAIDYATLDAYRVARALALWRDSGKLPEELEHGARASAALADRPVLWVQLEPDRAALIHPVRERIDAWLKQGWIEETRGLHARVPQAPALHSVGYAQIVAWLEGRHPAGRPPVDSLERIVDEITLATLQLIKRQLTWQRGQFSRAKLQGLVDRLDDGDASQDNADPAVTSERMLAWLQAKPPRSG